MRGYAAYACLIAFAAGSCGGSEPTVESVDPSVIASNTLVPLTISGSGFLGQLSGQIDDNRPLTIDDTWQVQIGGLPSTQVMVVDEHTLTATSPALEEGIFDVTVAGPDGRMATRANALTASPSAGLPDGGELDGSAGDSSMATDLAGADLSPSCAPPIIPTTVGPGPNLSITLSKVKINGGSNFAQVTAGAMFTLTANYSIKDTGGKIDQIIIGYNPPNAPLACLFNAVVPASGSSGTATLSLTAPTTPGTYTLRFHYGQAIDCSATNRTAWWSVNGAPTAAEDFAALCVQ